MIGLKIAYYTDAREEKVILLAWQLYLISNTRKCSVFAIVFWLEDSHRFYLHSRRLAYGNV